MRLITRTDSVPVDCEEMIGELTKRALKCGLKIVKTFDRTLPSDEKGVKYKTLVLEGSRLGFIRYWGEDIIKGNYEKGCLREFLKLMFG